MLKIEIEIGKGSSKCLVQGAAGIDEMAVAVVALEHAKQDILDKIRTSASQGAKDTTISKYINNKGGNDEISH